MGMDRAEEQLLDLDRFAKELRRCAAADRWYLERKEDVLRYTEGFRRIRESLSPEEQEILDLYISSCEELEYACAYIAYRLGREHERRGICLAL